MHCIDYCTCSIHQRWNKSSENEMQGKHGSTQCETSKVDHSFKSVEQEAIQVGKGDSFWQFIPQNYSLKIGATIPLSLSRRKAPTPCSSLFTIADYKQWSSSIISTGNTCPVVWIRLKGEWGCRQSQRMEF